MDVHLHTYDEDTDPKFWLALLIGISYKHHPNPKAHLDGPLDDVQRMKKFLQGLGWLDKNIVVLTDEDGIETTTAAAIIDAIDLLVAPSRANPAQSYRLVFYYAGHGAQEYDPTHQEVDLLNESVVGVDGEMPKGVLESPAKATSPPWTSRFAVPKIPKFKATKLFGSDGQFDMKVRPDPKRGGSTNQQEELGDEKKLSLQPFTTGTKGWIIDDTLRIHLCLPLSKVCRLRAFFDMCHSGTALDLPKTYGEENIPWEHRLQAIRPILLNKILTGRVKRESPAAPAKSAIVATPGDSAPQPPPTRTQSLPTVFRGVMAVGAKASFITIWTARLLKAIVCWPIRTNSEMVDPTVPDSYSVDQNAMQLAVLERRIVQSPTEQDLAVNAMEEPSVQADVEDQTLDEGREQEESHMLTPSLTRVSNETSSVAGSRLRPPPIALPVFAHGGAKSVPPSFAGADAISLPEGLPDRPISAPPERTDPLPPKVVHADVVCIGAAEDARVSSDSNSLARVFTKLWCKTPRKDLTHARLLVKLDRALKGQTPQMSSSYPLDEHWDRAYTL